MQERIWEKEVDEYVKQRKQFTKNKKSLYALVWGQCSVWSPQQHPTATLELQRNIKDIVFNFQDQRYLPLALHEAKRRLVIISLLQHDQMYMKSISLEFQ